MAKSMGQKIEQARARLQQLEAAAADAARRLDTRQKVIVGGTVLVAMRDDPELRQKVVSLLKDRVTRGVDRNAIAAFLDEQPEPTGQGQQQHRDNTAQAHA